MNDLSLTECHKRVKVTYGQDLALDLTSLLQFALFSEDRLWTEAARTGDSGRQSPGDVPNEWLLFSARSRWVRSAAAL